MLFIIISMVINVYKEFQFKAKFAEVNLGSHVNNIEQHLLKIVE